MTNKTALLFPGQGSQFVEMGKDFFYNFKAAALVFEEASDTVSLNLKHLCFEGPSADLVLTENLQPALFVTEAAMIAAIRSEFELTPTVVAGHSLGEFAAYYAAGSLSVSDGVKLTRLRGTAMQRAVPVGEGAMAAVLGLAPEQVRRLCAKTQSECKSLGKPHVVEPANYNAPGQIVIAGNTEAVQHAMKLAKSDDEFKGTKCIPLSVSAPFHCSLMEPARKEMTSHLAQTKFKRPSCFVLPNVTAEPVDTEYMFAGFLTDQIVRPVRWEESMLKLRALKVEKVIEIGPGKVLTGLHKRIDREMPIKNISFIADLKEAFKA